MTLAELREVDHIVIPACGTSWHAALIGEYLFEEFAHIPTEIEYASEFRYRNAPIEKHTLVLVITQSGETADTLAGLRASKRRGHEVLSICNVVGSTIAPESDGGIYLHAGPEIGVASTKAFTSQVTVLTLLALFMGRIRMLSNSQGSQIIRALEAIPKQMESILAQNEAIRRIALKFEYVRSEMNSQFANIATPSEIVVSTTFSLVGGAQAEMHICFPYSMMEPIRDMIYSTMQSDHLTQDNRWIKLLGRQLQTADVELVCNLGSAKLTLRDIVNMQVGDVIPINVPDLLNAEIDGIPVLEVQYGTRNGHYSIKVERTVAERDAGPTPPGAQNG